MLFNQAVDKRVSPRKYCRFKRYRIRYVDFKDPIFLAQFINDQGKILPRRITGNSLKFQKKIAIAVKRARFLGLLPFVTDGFHEREKDE